MLALRKGYRIVHFLWASLIMTGIGTLIILAYRLPNAFTDWVGIGTLIGATFIHAISATVIALGVQSLFAQLLGQVTGLQLLELARPDHPLLRYLLQNAPGTYQHSLQVANLAEQAAEAIGADPLLTRVGAIYHDVGNPKTHPFSLKIKFQEKSILMTTLIRNIVPGKSSSTSLMDCRLVKNSACQVESSHSCLNITEPY
jgi:putative nucleotidyltransferase with HDIG domain